MSSTSKTLSAITVLLLGCMVALFSRSAMSQSSARGALPSATLQDGQDGRYQIVPVGTGSNPSVYLIDTRTGRTWMQATPGQPWEDATPSTLPNSGPAVPVK